jgi:hypothetical protein
LSRADGKLFVAGAEVAHSHAGRENGGNFTGPVHVRLTAPAAGTMIRYTTDGTEPRADSPAYRQPVLAGRSVTLRPRTFKDGNGSGTAAAAVTTAG